MKSRILVVFIVIVALLIAACGANPEKKRPTVTTAEKIEYAKNGFNVVELDRYESEDKSISVDLPYNFLQLMPNGKKSPLMLVNPSSKEWITLGIDVFEEKGSFFDRSDELIKKQIENMYAEHPKLKNVYSVKKINSKWFLVIKNPQTDFYQTNNEKYWFRLGMSSKNMENDARKLLESVKIVNIK